MTTKRKLKVYDVTLDTDVFAVSLVDDPAIESNFIALSKEKKKVTLSEDKHIVLGAVLIPDLPIYRNQGGEEFYIKFSEQTINQLAHDFLIKDRNHDFTVNHKDEAKDVSVVESWIVDDPLKDKSACYGFNFPKGTWVMAAKVNNDELWSQIKEEGKANGFSIEAIAGLQEIKFKTDKSDMKDEKVKMEAVEITDGFWDKLRGIISDALGKPQESTEVEDTVGKITDEIEKGAGSKDEETKVVEQADEKKKKKTSCAEETSPKVDELIKETVDEVNENADTKEQAKDDLQAVIDGLQEEIKKKDAEIEALTKQNQKLSKQPSAKPVKTELEKKENPREIIEKIYNGTYFK